MRNLILHEKRLQETGVEDGILLAVDTLNQCLYIATKNEVNGFNTEQNEVN